MSLNIRPTLPDKSPAVYASLDLAKATLQLHFQTEQQALPNTSEGHARLLALLRAVAGAHLICEATGG
jgi:hypothetical protein